jgi:hypothetical protein
MANSLMLLELVSNVTPTATLTLQNPGMGTTYSSEETATSPTQASAQLTLTCKTDGTWAVTVGSGDSISGTPTSGNWGTPTTTGSGSSYEVKFTPTNQTGPGTVTNEASAYTTVSTDKIFRLTVNSSAGAKTGTLDIQMQVRKLGTTTPVADDTAAWTVTADCDSGA